MHIRKAFEKLMNGDKISHSTFTNDEYLILGKRERNLSDKIVDESGNYISEANRCDFVENYRINSNIIFAKGWFIVEDNEYPLGPKEAVEALENGHKIKKSIWREVDAYIVMLDGKIYNNYNVCIANDLKSFIDVSKDSRENSRWKIVD